MDREAHPWKRKRSETWGGYYIPKHSSTEKFDSYVSSNIDLDVDTKRLALEASPFVVGIVTHTGGEALFMGSGTIIRSEVVSGTYLSTILTSASLFRSSFNSNVVPNDIKVDVYICGGNLFDGNLTAYDLHYNLGTVEIESNVKLPTATIKLLDVSLPLNPREVQDKGVGPSWRLLPHSELFSICPGDNVVALGRYFREPYQIMAAPGKYSMDCCNFDCKELFRANCKIAICGIGGPLINKFGEVIGVNFYDVACTPFLSSNIVSKCLEQFRNHRFLRPWVGMKMANLHAASLGVMERILEKFPNISEGVLVEEVREGSPAGFAGIRCGDVIVHCSGNIVRSMLEFYEMIWEKIGGSVEVVVIREKSGERMQLMLNVNDTLQENFYGWPVPEKCSVFVDAIRL